MVGLIIVYIIGFFLSMSLFIYLHQHYHIAGSFIVIPYVWPLVAVPLFFIIIRIWNVLIDFVDWLSDLIKSSK
jgi:hypothetical protein